MEGKYLVFGLNGQFFGVPIAKVREIIRHEGITAIHDAVPCVRGVINLRGRIITIFDARERFGMPSEPYHSRTVFIIMDVLSKSGQPYLIGMAVDEVHQVEAVAEADIRHAGEIGLSISNDYLIGIIKGGMGLTQLLDIDRVIIDMHHGAPETGSQAGVEAAG